jgi:hypothetical protein
LSEPFGESILDPEALAILDDGSVDLSDIAERIDFIGPKVGKLRGHKVVKVDPNDPIAVSKAKAAIKDRHDRWAEHRIDKTGVGDGTPVITVLRISELERYTAPCCRMTMPAARIW